MTGSDALEELGIVHKQPPIVRKCRSYCNAPLHSQEGDVPIQRNRRFKTAESFQHAGFSVADGIDDVQDVELVYALSSCIRHGRSTADVRVVVPALQSVGLLVRSRGAGRLRGRDGLSGLPGGAREGEGDRDRGGRPGNVGLHLGHGSVWVVGEA